MGERLNADFVLAALNMALEQRTPRVSSTSAIAARYTSLAFGERCRLVHPYSCQLELTQYRERVLV